jgi:hypothetical protein
MRCTGIFRERVATFILKKMRFLAELQPRIDLNKIPGNRNKPLILRFHLNKIIVLLPGNESLSNIINLVLYIIVNRINPNFYFYRERLKLIFII